MNKPTFTFYNYKAYVNTLCLKELPEYDFIQILFNPRDKLLAVLPSPLPGKNSLGWCRDTGKKIPRHISCKIFSAKIFSLMGWDLTCRYRLPGEMIHVKDTKMFLFDLNSPEIEFPVSKKEPPQAPGFTSCRLYTTNFRGYEVFGLKENK